MIKLNLGCGNRKIHGFVNIDAREAVKPDYACDVTEIHKHFKDVDLIYACHVLEHFPSKSFDFQPRTWQEVLESWSTSLKPGGTIRLSVPDIKAACKYYLETNDFEAVKCFFYGGQKYDFDFHYHGWSFETIKKALEEAGFADVRLYDWKLTEHFFVDDYSQAFLPHMDKIEGRLMSLNVEATKILKKEQK